MDIQLQKQSGVDIFRNDVIEGLQRTPKKLSSKYFYDKRGDELFQQIMNMPEYYLSECELEIFKNKTSELADLITPKNNEEFDLIELGAGDAMKSTYLLKYLIEKGKNFTYMPIDISGNILSILQEKLSESIPELDVKCLEGEYNEMLYKASEISSKKKIVLFLGSTIGNMTMDEANGFCNSLHQNLSQGDIVLIGFDLHKNPQIILNAYNDKEGITAAFNLNLLTRINRELDADFNLENFQHYQNYDPETGACRSFLVSLCDQTVNVANETVYFKENELIDMEISQKFTESDIKALCENSGFKRIGDVKDSKEWFVDSAWEV